MSKNIRQNRRREPKVSQIDKQGWKSLLNVVIILAITVLLAAGIPYAIYLFYQHKVDEGHFTPEQITIHGNIRVDDASILEASGLQNEGVNLFEADLHVLESSIETLPWVKKATVEIHLPDKVDIQIEEHDPLGIVNDGQLYVVDQAGHEIKYWTSDDTLMAPIVSLDKTLDTRTHEVVKAFHLAEEVAKLGFPHKIQEIHYDNATGYTLYTDNTEIRLGYDRFEERIERLIAVNDLLENRQVMAEYILIDGDTSLDQVVVKPKPRTVVVPNVHENNDVENALITEKISTSNDKDTTIPETTVQVQPQAAPESMP